MLNFLYLKDRQADLCSSRASSAQATALQRYQVLHIVTWLGELLARRTRELTLLLL